MPVSTAQRKTRPGASDFTVTFSSRVSGTTAGASSFTPSVRGFMLSVTGAVALAYALRKRAASFEERTSEALRKARPL